jgi:hypothetical protein
MKHCLSTVACAAVLVLCAAPARGQPNLRPSERACVAAFKSAQQKEQQSRLRDAREQFQVCAQRTCSSLLRQECATRYLQLQYDIPSVVPIVTGDDGTPHVDVQVEMDGTLFVARLDGRALPVDPGVHEFSFSTDRGVFAREKIMVVQGQRNRTLSVSLRAPDAAPPRKEMAAPDVALERQAPTPDSRLRVPKATYALGAAGLVSLTAGALLTYWGRRDNDALAGCSPNCSQDSVRHIRNLYVAADVSFGVGLAALTTGYWVFARSRAHPDEPPPERATVHLDVQPARAGAMAMVSGSF